MAERPCRLVVCSKLPRRSGQTKNRYQSIVSILCWRAARYGNRPTSWFILCMLGLLHASAYATKRFDLVSAAAVPAPAEACVTLPAMIRVICPYSARAFDSPAYRLLYHSILF